MVAANPQPTLEWLFSRCIEDKSRGCWLWPGSHDGKGYSRIRLGGKRPRGHQVAYELLRGPISPDLEIDHLCRIRNCINPWHLEAVPGKTNVNRAPWSKVSRCPRGHEYTAENTDIRNGKRNCKTCEKTRLAARDYRRRA